MQPKQTVFFFEKATRLSLTPARLRVVKAAQGAPVGLGLDESQEPARSVGELLTKRTYLSQKYVPKIGGYTSK